MRNPERIDQFLAAIGKIWKDACPDRRFGQLISNLQHYADTDFFYHEEEDFLAILKEYFNKD